MGSTATADRVLVGRDEELALVRAFLDGLHRSGGLFLEGEPGIGKTSLWQAGVAMARERPAHVLTARPGETERGLSFAVLGDLLGGVIDVVGTLPAPQRRALRIALLLEPQRGATPDARVIGAAFLGCLRELAESGRVVVAVDDLQWADEASATALEFAFRRLNDEPVGLLATVRIARDESRPIAVEQALGYRLIHVPVDAMSLAAVYQLIDSHLGLRVSRPTLLRIHETTRGNPFFALELARALQQSGAEPRPGDPLPVPERLRDVIRARVARLSQTASETLLHAAALSRPTVAMLEAALNDPRRVELDVAEALEAGLIDIDADRIRFTHPLLASVHYASFTPRRRREVHRRLSEVVDDLEERARHLTLAIDGPDERVAAALEEAAGRAARRGATVAAADLAEQAFRRTSPDATAAKCRRVIDAATLRYAAGDTASALRALDETLDTTVDSSLRAELLWTKGRISFEGRHTHAGLELYREAFAAAATGDDLLRARILVDLSFASMSGQGTAVQSRATAEEAVDLARRAGDPATLARGLGRLASLKWWAGEGIATDLYEEAVALENSVGGLELDYGPTVAFARTLVEYGDLERARPLLEELCRRGRESGDAAVNMPIALLAALEFSAGNWERAAELAEEARLVALQSGREAAPRGLFWLAHVKGALGDVEEARTLGEEALALTQARGWKSAGPGGALGLLELSLENFEAAYDVMIGPVERYARIGTFQELAFDAVEALAALGRFDEADALLARSEPSIRGYGPWAAAAAARARGHVEVARDRLDAAEASFEAALALWEEGGRRPPFELARTLLALGAARRRAGKKRSARETLERALAIFEELGARVWGERTKRELARIGGRLPAGTKLTATESEIASLVAAGKSNREVARALHLSPKTVEWNLSKIYRKLGVRSRSELAARR